MDRSQHDYSQVDLLVPMAYAKLCECGWRVRVHWWDAGNPLMWEDFFLFLRVSACACTLRCGVIDSVVLMCQCCLKPVCKLS